MRHLVSGITVAILAGLVLTSSASAITIYDVLSTPLAHPTQWWLDGFGVESYTLMWNRIGPDKRELLNSSGLPGGPTGDYTGSWAGNPAWLNFKTGAPSNANSGTGPYQPSGILSGTVIPRLYTLESWDANRRFDFSVLFYDPGLTAGDELVATVILSGNFGTKADPALTRDPFNVAWLTATQVKSGTMVTFKVGAAAGEEVAVTIETNGTYAAGFFLDNIGAYTPTSLDTSASDSTSTFGSTSVAPEPATMALLAFGLGGIVMRRRRR